jgi:hypothetical protein
VRWKPPRLVLQVVIGPMVIVAMVSTVGRLLTLRVIMSTSVIAGAEAVIVTR